MQDSISIQQAIKEANDWLDYKGVEGIGAGREAEKICIIVYISCLESEFEGKIPANFHNYPVLFKKTGDFKAY